MANMADLMAEHEAALIAEANTPERIKADAELIDRNRAKMAAELASLERQGLLETGTPEACPGCGDPDCDYDCDEDYDGEGGE